MDDMSYEEYNRGKNNFVGILVSGLIIIGIAVGFFTTFKQETLVCVPQKNKCYIEKTNIAGLKSKKELITLSDIKNASFIQQRVKGNLYAKGYTSYLLIFNDKNNNRVIIFSTDYYDKNEVDNAIKYINTQLKTKDKKIILNRN